jgi:anaerobic magnesium-protoporphyrin IX monomethyl ester cyclase
MKKDFRILLFYPNEPLLGIAPSNLALLSACLKQDGFDVKLFDCTVYKPKNIETNDAIREKMGNVKKAPIEEYFTAKEVDVHEDFVKIVEEYKPNLIGFTLIDSTIEYAFSFIERIKDKKIPVITGGVGTTFNYEKILKSGYVDYTCIGEGEEALVELCNKMYNKEDCTNIKNIYTKDANGQIKKNSLRPLVNVDKLPTPDFSIYEYYRFYRPYQGGIVRMMCIDMDRGCPYVCTYCAAPNLRRIFLDNGSGHYFRHKNMDKIFDEMKYLIKEFDINFLWMGSETFLGLSLEKFEKFSKRYKEEIDLPFHCQTRLDTFTEEKTKLLVDMGCSSIAVAIEHGSEKIRLELLNKRLTNEQILKSFRILSKYNMIIGINNMIGLPGETRENIFETIELNRKVAKILKANKSFNVFTFIPFSGTKLRDICIEKGYISGDEIIPLSYFDESMLTMPSLSKKEIYGLEKTAVLYILLPKSYWPKIKIAEQDTEEGKQMLENLIKLIKK